MRGGRCGVAAGGPGGPRNQWVMLAVVVGVLLASTSGSHRAALSPNSVRIPYSPTFITQLKDGNIATISSTSLADQGTFKKAVRYQGSAPAKDFSTQIPSFANNQALKKLLLDKVTINAKNPNPGASLIESILFGFGPTLLFVLLFIFIMRRAASAGGAGGLMSFGRSRARRVEGAEVR